MHWPAEWHLHPWSQVTAAAKNTTANGKWEMSDILSRSHEFNTTAEMLALMPAPDWPGGSRSTLWSLYCFSCMWTALFQRDMRGDAAKQTDWKGISRPKISAVFHKEDESQGYICYSQCTQWERCVRACTNPSIEKHTCRCRYMHSHLTACTYANLCIQMTTCPYSKVRCIDTHTHTHWEVSSEL